LGTASGGIPIKRYELPVTTKVLICFSHTGGGHVYAANAISKALAEIKLNNPAALGLEVASESVIGKTSPINQAFVDLYNYLLRKHQPWMKYYIALIELFKPNDNAIGYAISKKHLLKLMAKHKPDLVVSVHPMVNQYLVMALKDAGLWPKSKLVIVITDPNAGLWSGWVCSDATLTIAPNDIAANKLIELGLAEEKIEIIGMPVDLAFSRPCLTFMRN